ncbi:MAG: hypothetical protein M5U09_19930 [Gammaproteobacteria bacterium]|nr:hypothetical protein [Gammaproteobacteria bacterium]
MSRLQSTEQVVEAQHLSAVEIGQNSNITGIISIDDTSQLTSYGGTTFNGDLSIGQAPSRANFFGSVADSFGVNDIHCDTNSVLHGILKGKTPSFAGGTISGQCDDQTTP